MVLDRLHSGVVQSSPEWSRLNTHDILMRGADRPPVPLDIYGSSTVPYISNGYDFTNSGRHGALSLTSLYCRLLAGLKGTGLMPVAVASLLLGKIPS